MYHTTTSMKCAVNVVVGGECEVTSGCDGSDIANLTGSNQDFFFLS